MGPAAIARCFGCGGERTSDRLPTESSVTAAAHAPWYVLNMHRLAITLW